MSIGPVMYINGMDSIFISKIKTGLTGFIEFFCIILTFRMKVRILNPPYGGKELNTQNVIYFQVVIQKSDP